MGWNELHTLVLENNATEIKDSVLQRGTIVRERTELSGMMPIHKACMYGRKAAFDELIELGADIKCETNWGSNCLHWVVKGFTYHKNDDLLQGSSKMYGRYNPDDYLAIAKYLLKEGSSLLNKKDRKGETPLDVAKRLSGSRDCQMRDALKEKKERMELDELDKAILEQKKRPKVRRL